MPPRIIRIVYSNVICNRLCKNTTENITPNTDDVEKIKMVLIVPILFNPCKKKKIDAANHSDPKSIIFDICIELIFILILDAMRH